jgi:hypothetical protein
MTYKYFLYYGGIPAYTMVLLRETISGRADDLKMGQKRLNPLRKFQYSAI